MGEQAKARRGGGVMLGDMRNVQGEIKISPVTRADRYEASREGNVRHTMVPLLLLTRSTWPPSCRAKEFDQPAAKPGIRASRIGPLPVVGDRQAKLSRNAL